MSLTMLTGLAAAGTPVDDVLTLDFAARCRSRQRVRLASGREAGLKLPRGTVLRGGDIVAGGGLVVRVEAAAEAVSLAQGSARELARAAYHLGNRHVAVEVGDGWLAWGHDHVLDAMIGGLGLVVQTTARPFEPEAGAYGGGHRHGDADGGPHAHGHAHHHHPLHHDHGDDHDHDQPDDHERRHRHRHAR